MALTTYYLDKRVLKTPVGGGNLTQLKAYLELPEYILEVIEDSGLASVGLTVPTGFSVANSPLIESGTLAVTNTFTAGSVVFAMGTGFAQDNVNFFWDNTNNRLGIGTNTPAQQLEITKNLRFTTTSADASTGIFYRDTSIFFHTFGINNIFLGVNAGNLTTSGVIGRNIGIGTQALQTLSTGERNIAVGLNAGNKITTASDGTFIGSSAGSNLTGIRNVGIGSGALQGTNGSATGTENTSIGTSSGFTLSTGVGNVFIGHETGGSITSGSFNIFIGAETQDTVVTGTTGSSNILIGYAIYLPSVSTSNYLSIGNTIYGNTSTGQVSIGVATQLASAKFQVDSTTKGFLAPRMTTTQRDAIATPAEGLEIYNLTSHKKQVYDGTVWQDCF